MPLDKDSGCSPRERKPTHKRQTGGEVLPGTDRAEQEQKYMLNAMRFTWGNEGYSKVGRQLSFYRCCLLLLPFVLTQNGPLFISSSLLWKVPSMWHDVPVRFQVLLSSVIQTALGWRLVQIPISLSVPLLQITKMFIR